VEWAELPQRPLWVISSHFAMRELYPLYPRKQTFGIASAIPLSAKSRHTPERTGLQWRKGVAQRNVRNPHQAVERIVHF